jgi:hypothetical protein
MITRLYKQDLQVDLPSCSFCEVVGAVYDDSIILQELINEPAHAVCLCTKNEQKPERSGLS